MDWGFLLSNTAAWLLMPETIAYAIATVGLAVHFGYGGLLNFGQAGFMALGAYGYAISILTFGFPWWGGILVGIGASVIFALLLGLPTLQLRADYLAIATIAAAEVVRLLFQSVIFDEYTNSADGLGGYHASFRDSNPFPDGVYGFGPWTYNEDALWIRVFGIGLLAVVLVLVWLFMRSPWGRVVKGIREDEDAVRSLGKNVYAYKMQALILGGVVGALGGVLWAHANAVQPDSMGRPTTFWIWTLLLLGGAATIWGPVLGSILFWVALVTVRNLAGWLIPESMMTATEREPFSLVLVGVTLMCLVVFRPQGLLSNRRELVING